MSKLDEALTIIIFACLSLISLKGCSEAAAQPLYPSVEDVIFYVAEEAEVEAWVIDWRVGRESSHNPGTVRYCLKWEPSPLKRCRWKCLSETDCRSNCRKRPEVWDNRLDVGLFQLRDAPSWSWVRWFNNEFDEHRGPECLLKPSCAADIAVEAIIYLKKRAKRERWKCKTQKVDTLAWLAWWNGCGTYAKAFKLYKQRKTVDRGEP